MGYDVRAKGELTFKPGQSYLAATALVRNDLPDPTLDEALEHFLGNGPNSFCLEGDVLDFQYNGPLTTRAESLDRIAAFVASGEIRWLGEDGARWRTIFSDGTTDTEYVCGEWF